MAPKVRPGSQDTPASRATSTLDEWLALARSTIPDSMVGTLGDILLAALPRDRPEELATSALNPLMAPVVGMAARAGKGTLGAAVEGIEAVAPRRIPNPIRAHHGSPHDFDAFDFSKIGTGEGAQAYGHGGYFAENPAVAREYERSLAAAPKVVTEKGDVVYQGMGSHFSRTGPTASKETEPWGLALAASDGDWTRAIKTAKAELAKAVASDARLATLGLQASPSAPGRQEILDGLIANKGKAKFQRGSVMYEVNIHATPDELLDWDKPLSEQPQKVREALGKLSSSHRTVDTMTRKELIDTLQYVDSNGVWSDVDNIAEFGAPATLEELRAAAKEMDLDEYLSASLKDDPGATGQSLYLQQTARGGGGNVYSNLSQAEVSEKLKQAGIKGIQYLDQGSRNRGPWTVVFKDGQKVDFGTEEAAERLAAQAREEGSLKYVIKPPPETRNFVIFDDQLIEIKRKFGFATTLAAAEWVRRQGGTVKQRGADQ